jgi:hypothetical protein
MSFTADGSPCPTCSPTAEDAMRAFEVAERVKNAKPARTVTVVDGPADSVDPNEQPVPAEAIFAAGEIAAQQAKDLAAMRGGR